MLAITVYRKGAEAIRQRLERYEEVITEKTQIIGELAHDLAEHQNHPASTEEPQTPETTKQKSPTFTERVASHRPPEQMSLVAEDKSTYARTPPPPNMSLSATGF